MLICPLINILLGSEKNIRNCWTSWSL